MLYRLSEALCWVFQVVIFIIVLLLFFVTVSVYFSLKFERVSSISLKDEFLFTLGLAVDWREFWLRDGNSGIHQRLSRPRLSEDHRRSDASRLVSRQKETAEEEEGFERPILEGSLSGNCIL